MNLDTDVEQYIKAHHKEDVHRLALQLRGNVNANYILRQIDGLQRLRHKVPLWAKISGIQFPQHLSIEQCSSEATAIYKYEVAKRLLPDGGRFVDLTGGFGIDFYFIAHNFDQTVYVERDAELCRLAKNNFSLLGLNDVDIHCSDASAYITDMAHTDLVFIDPARRSDVGRKVVRISDCSPDIRSLFPTLKKKANFIMIKLSPMLDITTAIHEIPGISEVHVVGNASECKELLIICPGSVNETFYKNTTARIFCHDEQASYSFFTEEEKHVKAVYATQIEAYLYDPSPTVMKSGALRLLTSWYSVKKVSTHSHLYTSDTFCESFPGRKFRIISARGFSKQELSHFKNTQANLAVRGFPDTTENLKKRLKIKDGGDVYIFACQDIKGKKLLIEAKKVV